MLQRLCALVLALTFAAAPAVLAEVPRSAAAAEARAWREANEKAVVAELAELMRLPNVATSLGDIDRNAEAIQTLLRRRGFSTRTLQAEPGTPVSVFGELKTPGAKRTVVFYAHFDGQPAPAKGWLSDPWEPVMRDGPPSPGVKVVDWRQHAGRLHPEWRLYGRSASDDKAAIIALVSALDALKAAGRTPAVNIKVFYEGEEEAGSKHLAAILAKHRGLLDADLWLLGDGPVHQTRRMQLFFGARGVMGLELTAYGPARPLHSGHYGNWAPNPAVRLAHLVARMRAEDGRILIPGFSEGVRPVSPAEQAALAALPDVETQLQRELGLARAEGGERLADSIMRPALNVRGLQAGDVGVDAANAIQPQARLSIDFRLVPNQQPKDVRARVEAFLQAEGWTLVDEEPDLAMRLAHPKLAKLDWEMGYPAARADMASPAARAVIAAVSGASNGVVLTPMLGGSVPMSLFEEATRTPIIGLPLANHDNNQHAVNENLRLQNLWDGIEVYAALIADLRW